METEERVDSAAPTVEEAIILGLARLGATRDEVEIQVLDAGSRGFLGLGAREAQVRLILRPAAPVPEAPVPPSPAPSAPVPSLPVPPAPVVPVPEPVAPPVTPVASPATPPLQAPSQPAAAPVAARPSAPRPHPAARSGQRKPRPKPETPPPPTRAEPQEPVPDLSGLDRALIERVTLEVAQQLFGSLRLHFVLNWRQEERPTLWLSLRGGDAEELVGPGARTLDELQYLVRLLVHRLADGNYNLVVDADGYRERRRSNLEAMARKAADRAVQSGRTVRLRSMPASERRLIHMTLQADPRVQTESIGTGHDRAVTIIPRSKER